jgi:chemotaxis receptor (MCP) glutamine deamidase CheD
LPYGGQRILKIREEKGRQHTHRLQAFPTAIPNNPNAIITMWGQCVSLIVTVAVQWALGPAMRTLFQKREVVFFSTLCIRLDVNAKVMKLNHVLLPSSEPMDFLFRNNSQKI